MLKRFAAIVLPELACEIARQDGRVADGPFAVIVDDDDRAPEGELLDRHATLDAVDARAFQYGARPGQTAAQATAFVGKLQVVRLPRSRLRQALVSIAESVLDLGMTAALELEPEAGRLYATSTIRYPLGAGAGPEDTVWLDVSGCARLVGGEDLLADELRERARAHGHRSRVAIADGPRIARAIARWSVRSELVAPAGQGAAALRPLPIAALPLDDKLAQWLLKLGLLRIEDLAQLDRARLAHRLGPRARDLLALVNGEDDLPLRAYEPPRRIVETAAFDQALDGTEPLLFVLRGLVARAASRLAARGQAAGLASLRLGFDASILSLRRFDSEADDGSEPNPFHELALELPVPLAKEDDLLRAFHAKIEGLTLDAPVLSVGLTLDGLTEKAEHQLDLHRKHGADPDALPTLLAELGAWLGPDRVGMLSLLDSHRPEVRSRLVAVTPSVMSSCAAPTHPDGDQVLAPSRLLPRPIALGKLTEGSLIPTGRELFLVDRLQHLARLDRVEWWSPSPLCRDYALAWIHHGPISSGPRRLHERPEEREHALALVYLDRLDGQGYLQGWFD
ncbi:MAG: DNA polymerase Y family protein [Myxococcales bacterium]|nr:DNA polymerase Y family protein [Myxococcales bacterium]